MHFTINNLKKIKNQLKELNHEEFISLPNIIAVSKTFSMEKILPLVEYGHIHFGENKIQESLDKWPKIKEKFPQIKLHMIGKIQSNKAKHVLPLFDYIHSGLPIICGSLPEIKKVVETYKVGVVVEDYAPETIAEKIQELVDNEALYYQIKLNQQKIKKGFCWENEQQLLDNYFY